MLWFRRYVLTWFIHLSNPNTNEMLTTTNYWYLIQRPRTIEKPKRTNNTFVKSYNIAISHKYFFVCFLRIKFSNLNTKFEIWWLVQNRSKSFFNNQTILHFPCTIKKFQISNLKFINNDRKEKSRVIKSNQIIFGLIKY